MRFLKIHAVIALLYVAAATHAATRAPPPSLKKQHAPPKADVDWDAFGFSMNGVKTDKMWLNRVTVEPGANDMELSADYSSQDADCLAEFGTFQMSPAATVLNYGQALFEGMKAFRRIDGNIALFRPERNALRMQSGAK
ncbi:MAG: hypothetical protein SGARI_007633, partial [Bacillariaceae sp.]